MPINRIQVGQRCRRVRVEILDMTLDQASARTGIDKGRLDAIEKGDVELSGDEVLIIADVYREPVEYFVMNESSASLDKATDLYRMYGNTFSSQDRQNIQEFLTLCRMEHEIEDLLGGRPRVAVFHPGRISKHMKTAGQETAQKLRLDFGYGDGPVSDPFSLLRRLGYHVFRRKLVNSRVSGVMLRHDDFGPCILVNYLEGYFRQNFSAAHELCHALLDNDRSITVTFEQASDEEREELRRREWRANSFAAHLLFPLSARKRLPLGGTEDNRATAIEHAAKTYCVNPIVVLYALEEARRITPREVASLKQRLKISRSEQDAADMAAETMKRRTARKSLLETGLAPEYVETCLRAYRQGEISFGKLADSLLVSPVDVPGVVSDFGLNIGALFGDMQ